MKYARRRLLTLRLRYPVIAAVQYRHSRACGCRAPPGRAQRSLLAEAERKPAEALSAVEGALGATK